MSLAHCACADEDSGENMNAVTNTKRQMTLISFIIEFLGEIFRNPVRKDPLTAFKITDICSNPKWFSIDWRWRHEKLIVIIVIFI